MNVPKKSLWEILVPTMMNEKPVRTRYHRVWDAKVRSITGGLTILKPAKGQWICPESGDLFDERMIPVRIACTRNEIFSIAEMTKIYYNQMKVLIYRVADEVHFV